MSSPLLPTTYLEMARPKKEGKKPPHGLWAVLGAALALFGGMILGTILLIFLLPLVASPDFMEQVTRNHSLLEENLPSPILAVMLLSTTSLSLIGGLLWIRFFEKRSLASFGLGFNLTGLWQLLRGVVFGAAAMAVGVYFLLVFGWAELSAPSMPQGWVALWPFGFLAMAWLVQGTSEEVLLRGLVFQSIGVRHGLLAGALVSSILFSLLHGLNPNTSPLFFLDLFLFSLFACFYVLREGSLWGIAGYHGAWNFAQGHLFGIPISGSDIGADKLMTFTATGPDFLTGGAAGLEGGLASTLTIILSGIVILLLPMGRRSAKD